MRIIDLADNHLKKLREPLAKLGEPESYKERNFTLGVHAVKADPHKVVKEEFIVRDADHHITKGLPI